jgi:hypothetical protein
MARSKTFFLTFLLMAGLSGCASIGPRTIVRDRFDYVTAISDSWKSQTLLNLVKIRYGDAPVFLNVDSAINQYSVESSFTLSGTWFINPFEEHNAEQSLSALGGYSDKPTITYTPLSGEKFARNLMAPIPPAAILNLLQAGYPADMVLRACVHAINGIHSRFGGGTRARPADAEFYPLIEKMRKLQLSGEIGIRTKETEDHTATLFVFRSNPSPESEADSAEVRRMLGLDPAARELSIVYGSVAAHDKELALLTRSMLEILIDLSSYIQVPTASVEERRTYASPPPDTANGAPVAPLIQIFSSPKPPPDAFTAVPYRQGWYWIDDKDFPSKSFFSFIMFLFTLTETEGTQKAPVITLPAG